MDIENMGRKIVIALEKDGTFFYWAKGKGSPARPRKCTALPLFTVHSVQDAEELKQLACRKTYPPNSRYIINDSSGFNGELESMEKASEYLYRCYEAMLQRRLDRVSS